MTKESITEAARLQDFLSRLICLQRPALSLARETKTIHSQTSQLNEGPRTKTREDGSYCLLWARLSNLGLYEGLVLNHGMLLGLGARAKPNILA